MYCTHLQMRITRHKNVFLFVGAFGDYSYNALQCAFNFSNFVHEPEPRVSRDLIISRSASMQLSSNGRPRQLAQPPFVGSMNIFIVGMDLELWFRISPIPRNRPVEGKKRNHTVPFFHSSPTRVKPSTILSFSSSVRRPTRASDLAYAIDPRISAEYIRLS
jgi:hypothetical protein